MEFNSFRRLYWAGVLSLLPVVLSNCSTSSDGGSSPADAGNGGDSGAAGDTASGISICGMPAAVSKCDPLTGIPCNVAVGETCDETTALDAFDCISGPNAGLLGGFCDNDTVSCGPTTICSMISNSCVKFCCADSECSDGPCTQVYTDGKASVGACLGILPPHDDGEGGAAGANDAAAGAGG